MPRTTAQRSATAKAAYAKRAADKAVGIPSIASLAASLHADKPWRSKAEARREAVRQIEGMRAEMAAMAERVTAAASAPARSVTRRAVTDLALRLYIEQPSLGRDGARAEAERSLMDGTDADLLAACTASYWARMKALGSALIRR